MATRMAERERAKRSAATRARSCARRGKKRRRRL